MKENSKTHWLQSPNKNYLGHWDLPEGEDLTLTIESAAWEKVTNPITNTDQDKRVVRFKEDVKPWICNQVNATSIIRSTGIKYMEDSKGCVISLYVGQTKMMGDLVDCVRVRNDKKSNVGIIEKNHTLLKQIKESTIENIKSLYEVNISEVKRKPYLITAFNDRKKELGL